MSIYTKETSLLRFETCTNVAVKRDDFFLIFLMSTTFAPPHCTNAPEAFSDSLPELKTKYCCHSKDGGDGL